MPNVRSEGDVVVSGKSGESGIGAGALGDQLLRPRLGGRGVLGDVGLDTFNSEPVCYFRNRSKSVL